MILTLELLHSVFVTMGTRLERTEVTLCGSNTELIHRVLPSWEFHMVSTSSHQGHGVFSAILLSHYYTLMSTYSYLCTQPHFHPRTPQTFSSFTAGCLLVRGLALVPRSRHFKAEPCNYQPITPVWCSRFFPFVPAVFHIRHCLCVVWDQLSAVVVGKLNCSPFLPVMLSSQ